MAFFVCQTVSQRKYRMNTFSLRHPVVRTMAFVLLALGLIALLTLIVYPRGIAVYMGAKLPTHFPMTFHYGFEIASWFLLWLLVYFASSRFLFSLAVVMALYFALLLGNVEKMRLLHAPLMLTDVYAVKELARQKDMFASYLMQAGLFLAVALAVGWLLWKKSRPDPVVRQHRVTLLLSVVLVVMLIFANRFAIARFLAKRDLYFNKVNLVMSVFQYGGLATMLQGAFFVPPYKHMAHYNKRAVIQTMQRYGLLTSTDETSLPAEPINLIVVLAEAFTDPEEMGWQTTQDALPTFHQVRKEQGSGRLLSPVLGGKSANAEFELLTGMSMRFTPVNAIPYTDLIHNDIPSLARFLGQHGYLTMAIHVASLDFFNYKNVYRLAGFGMFTSLWDKAPKADPMGVHPSRQELFKLIARASEFHQPYFLFTFPNYTHGDWRYDTFADSQLDVIDPENRLQGEEKQRVKTYINALHYTDELFRDLIAHFSQKQEKVLIVMLGDHQPFLEGYRQKAWQRTVEQYGNNQATEILANYWVPVAIWSNFPRQRDDFAFSMNFMASYLIEQLGLQPTGFYRLNQILRDKIGVFSWVIRQPDGTYAFHVPPEYRQLIKDYELIQYDILQGENFFARLLAEKKQAAASQ